MRILSYTTKTTELLPKIPLRTGYLRVAWLHQASTHTPADAASEKAMKMAESSPMNAGNGQHSYVQNSTFQVLHLYYM